MIIIKKPHEIEQMAVGGKILAGIIAQMVAMAKPGVATQAIDNLALELCKKNGVKPAFLGYGVKGAKYPAVACLSVNDAIVHSPPTDRKLEEGDVLGIDMGVVYREWNSDSAVTMMVGSEQWSVDSKLITNHYSLPQKLIAVTRDSMYLGIQQAIPGNHVGDIGHAVQTYVEKHGFGVVRELVGHGIGRELHEEPRIPNYGKPGEGPKLKEGMVICIEPMVTAGDWKLVLDKDGFTYRTKDGLLAAHFEHTVAITKTGPIILT